jgi:hypothetical protein
MKTKEYYEEKYLEVLNHIEEFMKDEDISDFDKKHASVSFACWAINHAANNLEEALEMFELAKTTHLERTEKLAELKKNKKTMN